jgi:5'(3')-deoxyribonucleotidase
MKIQFHEMIFDLQIKNMLNKINNAIKNFTKLNNIFISSDDKFYKNKFIFELKRKYNVYFNKSKFQTTKLRQTRGIDFITELFCLSRSKIVISSVGGGVVQAAYLISGRKIKIYKWINIINPFFFLRIITLVIFYSKRLKVFFLRFNF